MSVSRGAPAPNQSEPAASSSGPDAPDPPFVLVVDDEPFIVDLLTLALEDEGYQVAGAYDGEQAWDLVHQQPPDLIITDVSMPRLDGVDLVRRLRCRRVLASIPVILMSAARRAVEVPGAVFVPKPFDLDRLLSLVQAKLAA